VANVNFKQNSTEGEGEETQSKRRGKAVLSVQTGHQGPEGNILPICEIWKRENEKKTFSPRGYLGEDYRDLGNRGEGELEGERERNLFRRARTSWGAAIFFGETLTTERNRGIRDEKKGVMLSRGGL